MPVTQTRPVARRAASGRRTGRILLNCTILLGIGAVLYFVLPALARRATDWLWFRELGLERIFLAQVKTQWTLGLATSGLAFVFLYLNIRLVKRRDSVPVTPEEERVRRLRQVPTGAGTFVARIVDLFAVPIAVIGAAAFGIWASSAWISSLLHLHRTPFGEVDPLLGRDVSYYVFTLPVIEFLFELIFVLLMVTTALVATLYVHRRRFRRRGWRLTIHPDAAVHLAGLLAILSVGGALFLHFVRIPGLVYSTTGPFTGASYTDLHARLPALRISVVLALATALIVSWGAWTRRLVRTVTTAVPVGAGLFFLTTYGFPAAYQRFIVLPNELEREAAQIEQHLRSTKQAWGLANIEMRELHPGQTLTDGDVRANGATIHNVNLWNRDLLLQTFGQLQSIRTYYDFVSVDEDRYWINGEYRQVHLAARELNVDLLPVRSFINERMTYTHGVGLVLGPSNQTTAEGLPQLFIKDLPPVSTTPLQVTRPEIYYGELPNDYVFARMAAEASPRDEGDRGGAVTHAGTGGVMVDTFLRRVLFALRFRSLNILLSGEIGPDTRALYYRNIRDRAQKVLPGIRLDGDPYLVIAETGRLKWVLDAYTTSRRYPYAESPLHDGTNYMRNTVKVVIDAYDGDVKAYLAEPSDPLIRTWQAAFPGILQPMDSLSSDIRAHLRYPDDLFRAQAALYGIYHMDDPAVFYHREDQWAVPAMPHQQRPDGYMQRMVMRLPGDTAPEFVTMTPFTPRHKDNLAAWMVARSDEPHYGDLVVYRFPRQSLIYGPKQIMNRINQDTEISRLVSLWDQSGSQVIWGDLLVIPIEQSLLYIQPLYLRAEGGRIPELKRVVLAHQNRVVMEESLEGALGRLFGEEASGSFGRNAAQWPSPGVRAADPGETLTELIRQAEQHYEAARAAQRADDWAGYGREMRALGDILRRLGGSAAGNR